MSCGREKRKRVVIFLQVMMNSVSEALNVVCRLDMTRWRWRVTPVLDDDKDMMSLNVSDDENAWNGGESLGVADLLRRSDNIG